jgi:succinate dehydrogenase/fumarate reductase flavoprotein subunit
MEFSNAYAIAPAFASVTKTLFYNWATFTYPDGTEVPGAKSQGGRSAIARALLTQQVYAQIDKADLEQQGVMRLAQPNFFMPFDRRGIDPFKQRFPVTLRLEGTVRGTGGLRLVDDTCATGVAGLYAAGDAASHSTRKVMPSSIPPAWCVTFRRRSSRSSAIISVPERC